MNTLRMSVSDQRVSISSISLSVLYQLSIIKNNKIRINKFDIYYRDCTDLKNWFIQIDIYFIFYSVSANQKTIFVLIFFRKRTQYWLKSNLQKYLKNYNKNLYTIFTNFDNFKKELRRIFEIFNKKQIAKKVIQYLTQQIFAANYVAKFQKYINLIE